MTITKKIITTLGALSLLLALPFAGNFAGAATIDVGNPAIDRANLDAYTNFVVVDTGNPVSMDGTLDTFTYYAKGEGEFHFLLLDSADEVQWISPLMTPSAGEGVKTWNPATPVEVEEDWMLAVHFEDEASIPYDTGSGGIDYTANNSGSPAEGDTVTYEGSATRMYSFGATGTDETNTLTVAKSGSGDGTVTSSPTGINCGSDCSEGFAEGTEVTLMAVADSDSTFANWSGACSGTSNTCVLTLDEAKTVTATFNDDDDDDGDDMDHGDKDSCKNGGWRDIPGHHFITQGECVSHMARHEAFERRAEIRARIDARFNLDHDEDEDD